MKKITILISAVICFFASGCAGTQKMTNTGAIPIPSPLTMIAQIESFKPEVACSQALEVVNNNPYTQEFFEKIFAKLVVQSKNSANPENADIIWDNFVNPLNQAGKVPPDLAKKLWNYYFSKVFSSLPDKDMTACCRNLSSIKKNIEKEYILKQEGFLACKQGDPDVQFSNAMRVYNAIWAVCNEVK